MGWGSIPACAGEPVGNERRGSDHRVYPRVCGGTSALQVLVRLGKGLSPRVRGNRASDRVPFFTIGSIPACAGEPIELDCDG